MTQFLCDVIVSLFVVVPFCSGLGASRDMPVCLCLKTSLSSEFRSSGICLSVFALRLPLVQNSGLLGYACLSLR